MGHREVHGHAECHTAGESQSWDLNPSGWSLELGANADETGRRVAARQQTTEPLDQEAGTFKTGKKFIYLKPNVFLGYGEIQDQISYQNTFSCTSPP